MANNKHKIESKRALSLVLIIINALVILPIMDSLGTSIINAIAITVLSITEFLYDSRKGDLHNSFLSSLIFMATTITIDNIYNDSYLSMPFYKQIIWVLLIFALFYATPYIVKFVLAHINSACG